MANQQDAFMLPLIQLLISELLTERHLITTTPELCSFICIFSLTNLGAALSICNSGIICNIQLESIWVLSPKGVAQNYISRPSS